jgi:hypothetical protein
MSFGKLYTEEQRTGHYILARVKKLPPRGDVNKLYFIVSDSMTQLYRFGSDGFIETIKVGEYKTSIEEGSNVEITGDGTQDSPYIINALDTTGLLGTQYVFVQANGTDIENAIELQAAYDLAITKITTAQILSAPYDFPLQNVSGIFSIYDFSGAVPVLIEGQFYTFNVEGADMLGEVVSISSNQYFVEFPTAFTYNGGTIRVYTPETVKSTVIAAPGNYNFENGNFIMDTEHVDLVSLDGNRSIVFNGHGAIAITANNVFVKGVDVLSKTFSISTNLPDLIVENCKGEGEGSFVENGISSGTFINCQGGNSSFSGIGTASGTFTNCQGGLYSFGGQGGIASGTFNDCKGEGNSFGGAFGGTASGTFTNCQGGSQSFGSDGEAPGIFTNCQGHIFSFGGQGEASGTFINCQGGQSSFGGQGGIASGTFINCQGGADSFGGFGGTLSGKLYYCRLTGGLFINVSSGGKTILCIDGDNNQNNQ